jgi:hypothetical protein
MKILIEIYKQTNNKASVTIKESRLANNADLDLIVDLGSAERKHIVDVVTATLKASLL